MLSNIRRLPLLGAIFVVAFALGLTAGVVSADPIFLPIVIRDAELAQAPPQDPYPGPSETPTVTSTLPVVSEGLLRRSSEFSHCDVDFELVDCSDNHVEWVSCEESRCGPLVGQWVEVRSRAHIACDPIPPLRAVIYQPAEQVVPLTNPCQPTATTGPPPTPTRDSCEWQFDHLGPPEGCRWFDRQGLPVRFNIEKRILLPNGKTRFVENSFFLMDGYAGYVVGEGDYTIYCVDTSEAEIRNDMVAHMARRRLDPEFIRDGKDIGEVTVAEARAWGILRDTCDGTDVLLCKTTRPPFSLTGSFTVDAGELWHAEMWVEDYPSNPQEWSTVLKPGFTASVQARAHVPNVWPYSSTNYTVEMVEACAVQHIERRRADGFPHDWANSWVYNRVFGVPMPPLLERIGETLRSLLR